MTVERVIIRFRLHVFISQSKSTLSTNHSLSRGLIPVSSFLQHIMTYWHKLR